MNDNELRDLCIMNYGIELLKNCGVCPYKKKKKKKCDGFIERHNGNTPLFG